MITFDTPQMVSPQFNQADAHELFQRLLVPVLRPNSLLSLPSRLKVVLVRYLGPPSLQPIVFLPTGAYLLLRTLRTFFPRHGLILADFDELPGTRVSGLNAPLVQRTEGNQTEERGSYLDAELGRFDMLFPTDFTLLHVLHQALGGGAASTPATKSFMKQNAALAKTRTRSGYNPLVEDFINTKLFLAEPWRTQWTTPSPL